MKQIAAAFVKAQRAFGPALKTHTNPAFKSKYADLSACVEAVMDALNANGIALMQHSHEVDSGVTIETVFVHESGEVLSSGKLHVPAAKQDPQGYGSALTYARRYSLMAACGIAPEDDDGNAAAKAQADAQANVLQALRDASMLGTEALRAAYAKHQPTDAVWKAHQVSLKKAAAAADKAAQPEEATA
jgi:hypothetical protein